MILCAGEALIDMLPRTSEQGEPAFHPAVGGAVFNTAIALGRLGAPASFFSGLSTDLFGIRLVAALADSNVSAALCSRSGRPTTLAFVELTNGQAKYAFYDENTAGAMLTPQDLPTDLDGFQALFFGGISLVGEPCGEAYKALALREASRRVIMMDPNIRPSFIQDPARYRARLEAMLAVTDIVKISDEDLDWLLPDLPLADQITALGEMGPKLICLTAGAKGVTAFGVGDAPVFAPSQRVEVVDTVGAGDTFNAGLLAGLSRAGLLTKAAIATLTPEQVLPCLHLGAAAAAVTVSRAGANPPWLSELD